MNNQSSTLPLLPDVPSLLEDSNQDATLNQLPLITTTNVNSLQDPDTADSQSENDAEQTFFFGEENKEDSYRLGYNPEQMAESVLSEEGLAKEDREKLVQSLRDDSLVPPHLAEQLADVSFSSEATPAEKVHNIQQELDIAAKYIEEQHLQPAAQGPGEPLTQEQNTKLLEFGYDTEKNRIVRQYTAAEIAEQDTAAKVTAAIAAEIAALEPVTLPEVKMLKEYAVPEVTMVEEDNAAKIAAEVTMVQEDAAPEVPMVEEDAAPEVTMVQEDAAPEVPMVEEAAAPEVTILEQDAAAEVTTVEEDNAAKIAAEVTTVEEAAAPEVTILEQDAAAEITMIEQDTAPEVPMVEEDTAPEVKTVRQKIANWFAPVNKKLNLLTPKLNAGFSFIKESFSIFGKSATGVLTAWFGMFLKVSALLALSSLVFVNPLALVIAGIGAMFLPISVVLPLAALTFLAVPVSAALFGALSAASVIALAVVGAGYALKLFRVKTPEFMVFHEETAQLTEIGVRFFEGIERLVSKLSSVIANLPQHANDAYANLPETPACIKQPAAKAYAALPDTRGFITNAFATTKKNVAYYTGYDNSATEPKVASASGRSSPKHRA